MFPRQLARQQEDILSRRLQRLTEKHNQLTQYINDALPYATSLFHACGCDPTGLDIDLSIIMKGTPDHLKPHGPRAAKQSETTPRITALARYLSKHSMTRGDGNETSPPESVHGDDTASPARKPALRSSPRRKASPATRRQSSLHTDTKLSAHRRRLSLGSIGADPAEVRALLLKSAQDDSATPAVGSKDDKEETLQRTAGRRDSEAAARTAKAQRALDKQLAAAKRKLLRSRSNRVQALQAFLNVVGVQRSIAALHSGTTATVHPTWRRRQTVARPRRATRKSPLPQAAMASGRRVSTTHSTRGRAPSAMLPSNVVVGAAKNLFGPEPAHVDRSNVCNAIAAVESRVSELLVAEARVQKEWSTKMSGDRTRNSAFIDVSVPVHAGCLRGTNSCCVRVAWHTCGDQLASGMHNRLARRRPRSTRLEPASMPGMHSSSLVVSVEPNTDKTTDGRTVSADDPAGLFRQPSEVDLVGDADDNGRMFKPVSIEQLRSRKWAVEPNQRQRYAAAWVPTRYWHVAAWLRWCALFTCAGNLTKRTGVSVPSCAGGLHTSRSNSVDTTQHACLSTRCGLSESDDGLGWRLKPLKKSGSALPSSKQHRMQRCFVLRSVRSSESD